MSKQAFLRALMLFGTPVATAFLDYEVNSSAPFSKQTLAHAALATALVAVAEFRGWLQVQVKAAENITAGPGGAS